MIRKLVDFKKPAQVQDPIHPFCGNWYVESEKQEYLDMNDNHGIPTSGHYWVYLTQDREVVAWIQLNHNDLHKGYFKTEAEAYDAMADYNIGMFIQSPDSPKTVSGSTPLFED